MGLKEGDDVTVHVAAKAHLELERTPDRRELLARLRKYRGRLPADFRALYAEHLQHSQIIEGSLKVVNPFASFDVK